MDDKTLRRIASLLIVVTILLGIIEIYFSIYNTPIVGVVQRINSRYKDNYYDGISQERFAVLLRAQPNPYCMDDRCNHMMVDCLSTRCSLLQEGDTVNFICRRRPRIFEPSVVECKMR